MAIGPHVGQHRFANLPIRFKEASRFVGLGHKVFGALLATAGAVIALTGHWATPNDMIADLVAALLMVAMGVTILLMWSFQR
jgi:hypothetical protein